MTISVSTELPIAAERACELAQKPAMLSHVLWPWMRLIATAPLPETIAQGDEIVVRLCLFGVMPAWRHTVLVAALSPQEIVSREHGGPITTWDHRLSFQPTSAASCRYTDAVEIRAGLLTPFVTLYAHFIYRYRQARWRALARVLA
ncbi:MAG TPA: hypothetical protein VN892_10025 [Solirubrobacteraceae bacterium]|nr:hypothetical protein [Solirubrobacteraceae bacterium]